MSLGPNQAPSSQDFDPSDYERPRVRGVLKLASATVAVLLTRAQESGHWRASATISSTGDDWSASGVAVSVTAPTPREAWSALAVEIGRRLEVLR